MGSGGSEYTLVERQQAVRLRGADNQQNDTGILYLLPGITTATGSREGALTQGTGGGTGLSVRTGISMAGFELFNSSGGAITVALGVRLPNNLWRAGQWVNAAAIPYTDDTKDAQGTETLKFALETTTNNDGHVIHSEVPFNAVSYDVGTAGDAATYAARHSSADGAGWTAMASTSLLASDSLELTGERIWFWRTPATWGRTQRIGLNGIPGGRYAWNLRATAAPASTAAMADSLSLYRFYFIHEALTNNTLYTWWPGGGEAFMAPGDALVAYFGTADNLNGVTALVRPRL